MRLFAPTYRDLPRFMLRRIDNIAGHLNGFLLIAALGLAMFDLLVVFLKFVDGLPGSVVQAVPHVAWMH